MKCGRLAYQYSLYLLVAAVCSASGQYYCDLSIEVDQQLTVSEGCLEAIIGSAGDNETQQYTCSSFQRALEYLEELYMYDDAYNCTEILLSNGDHVVSRNFTITSNVHIRPVDRTHNAIVVSFKLTDTILLSKLAAQYKPLYVLNFKSTEFAVIEGLTFYGSNGTVSFYEVDSTVIDNCTFRYFIDGAVDVYNCLKVTITSSLFEHNGPVSNVLRRNIYNLHSGAVAISVGNLVTNVEPVYEVRQCIFVNNSALPSDDLFHSTSDIFLNFVLNGRGGALGFGLNGLSNGVSIRVIVEQCLFLHNSATNFGGAMYAVFGAHANHRVTVKDNRFNENTATNAGGGLFIGSISVGTEQIFSSCYVTNNEFYRNSALAGGAAAWPNTFVSSSVYNYIVYDNCTFKANNATHSSAITILSSNPFNGNIKSVPIQIINCKFLRNKASDTTITTLYSPLVLSGHNIFDGNIGGAIQIVGSIAQINGTLEITNTEAVGLATLQLTSFGQIQLLKDAHMIFSNNTGRFGSSIASETQSVSKVYSRLLYNPLCFILYYDRTKPPNEWSDVAIDIIDNRAIVGSVAFVTLLDVCSWTQNKNPFFDISGVMRWNFVNARNNRNKFHEEASHDPIFNVQTPPTSITVLNDTVSAYPGQSLQLQMRVDDELGLPVGAVLRVQSDENTFNAANPDLPITFDPEVELFRSKSQLLTARVHVHENSDRTGLYPILARNVDARSEVTVTQTLKLRKCPPGYVYESIYQTNYEACSCTADNVDIVTCDGYTIYLNGKVWGTYDANAEDGLYTHSCPPLYCQCNYTSTTSSSGSSNCYRLYDYTDENEQCQCNREGVLCGECANNTGVSALLDNCVSCHNASATLIALLIVLDVAVLVLSIRFLLYRKYPIWLLPCIFYIQMLPFGTVAFSDGFQILVRPYLYYVSSLLGLYFPYDFCLYENMSAQVAYFLRLIPTLLSCILVPALIKLCWKFANVRFKLHWQFLSLFVLLLYPHAIHTAMMLLHCPQVPIDGATEIRWFVDGSVSCFSGGHIVLVLLSLIVVLVGALMIPASLILSLKSISKTEVFIWLRRLKQAQAYPFKQRWWYSIELFRRFVLLLMIVPFPGKTYPLFFMFCLTSMAFLYVRPYRDKLANALEVIFSLTTILLYLLSLTVAFTVDIPNAYSFTHIDERDNCQTHIRVGALDIIEGILYYVPLLVTIVVVCIYSSKWLYAFMKQYILKMKQKRQKDISLENCDLRRPRIFSTAVVVEAKSHTEVSLVESGSWKTTVIQETTVDVSDTCNIEIPYTDESDENSLDSH